MDCERFDRIALDLLYDELDELTAASARRHVDQCARCRGILAGLRATREVGALPLVDPPPGLELSILEAEQRARSRLPLQQRLGRGVSVLAGYAMRPQLAMAALFLFVIGSSLLLLRGRPGAPVQVSEQGRPEKAAAATGRADEAKQEAAARAPAPAAAAKGLAADRDRSGSEALATAAEAATVAYTAAAGAKKGARKSAHAGAHGGSAGAARDTGFMDGSVAASLEEITVTAEKRDQALQRSALAVTALPARVLEREQARADRGHDLGLAPRHPALGVGRRQIVQGQELAVGPDHALGPLLGSIGHP